MSKLENRKQITMLTLICSIVYFVSYLTRKNFAVLLVAITESEGIANSALGLVLTWNSIAYGVGQPISGYLGDKFDPVNIIFLGLSTTTVVNLLMPFVSPSVPLMTILWVMNGLAQALMWPPLVKILTNLLTSKDYKKACVTVSTASSAATILLYLISPVFLSLSGWKSLFFFSALCGFVITLFWKPAIRSIEKKSGSQRQEVRMFSAEPKQTESFNSGILIVLALIMLAIVLQGYLRDGIESWMPSFVKEVYGTNSSTAILSSVVLPIFSILCFHLTSFVNAKLIKNEMLCSAFFFALAAAASALLALNLGKNIGLAITLSAVITGCMHAVNLILNCYAPAYFRKYGRVSLVSGLLNACTYVGGAIAVSAIPMTTEAFGWGTSVMIWAVIGFGGVAICLGLIQKWKTIKQK